MLPMPPDCLPSTGISTHLEYSRQIIVSLHGAGSINQATTPSRAQPWVDYVTQSISLTRSFFFQNRESLLSASGNLTISRYASEKIAQNANSGQLQYLLVLLHPEFRGKPFSITVQQEEAARTAIIDVLWRFPLFPCTFCFCHLNQPLACSHKTAKAKFGACDADGWEKRLSNSDKRKLRKAIS